MRFVLLATLALGLGCRRPSMAAAPGPVAPGATVSEIGAYRSLLAPGDSIQVTVREVRYPPGGMSEPHRHPCAVVGYVVEGQVRFAVGDEPERVLGPGQTFHENPGDLHRVSANASRTAPVRFLATFICPQKPAESR